MLPTLVEYAVAGALLLQGARASPDDSLEKLQKQLYAVIEAGNKVGGKYEVARAGELFDRLLDFAADHTGEDVAIEACITALQHAGICGAAKEKQVDSTALDFLLDGWIDSPRLVEVVTRVLQYHDLDVARAALETIERDSKCAENQLACKYVKLARRAGEPKIPEPQRKALVAELRALEQEHAAVLDSKSPARDWRRLLEDEIFKLERLCVGAVAPDVDGKDLDGAAFKLSEYRGKVVLLDFWGFW